MNQVGYQESLINSKKAIDDLLASIVSHGENRLAKALAALMSESSRELGNLIQERSDLTHASIQVRNIFEIYLISVEICSDTKRLDHWYGQIHKDLADIQTGFLELFESKRSDVLKKDIDELKKAKQLSDTALEGSDYQSKGGFNIRDLSEKHGYLKDYKAIHKMCSKLAHPTSLKVNFYQELASSGFMEMLENIGAYFARKTGVLCFEIRQGLQA